MKRLFLTLTAAAAVTAGAASMSAQAASSPAVTAVKCDNSVLQTFPCGQWIVINDEEGKEEVKALLEKCGIDLDALLGNICSSLPGGDTGTPEPDGSVTVTPTPEPSEPDSSVTVTPSPSAPEETQPVPPIIEDETPDSSDSSESVHPYVLRIVELVNEERAKAGLNPVTLDTSASQAALVRSKEIVKSFSHTRPDGRSFTTALKEQGINYRYAGENIAWGQRSPEQVMDAWMNSSGHRANILNENFTHIGVGYYQENGVNYWTQLFYN